MKDLKKKFLKFSSKNKYKILILIGVFAAAVFLRILYLPKNAISFAYDQARDAFVVSEILNGDYKILGPSVSGIPGLYHGVLYYYLLAVPYLSGHGNPVYAGYFFSILGSLVVFTVFWLAYILSKSYNAALLSAIFFAVSFEASQYSNLLTNVTMSPWFVPLIYIGLYLWLTGKRKTKILAPLTTGAAFGLAIQSEFALLYHLTPILIWLFLNKKKITIKEIVFFVVATIVATSTMILVELKFGFQGVGGILYLLSRKDEIANSLTIRQIIFRFIEQFGEAWTNNLFPVNLFLGSLLGFGMIVISLFKEKISLKSSYKWNYFLISYLAAHLVVLPFGGSNMRHIMVGAGPGIAVFAGIFTWKHLRGNRFIFYSFIILILLFNIFKIVKENKNGQTIFPLQKDLVLSKELDAVDYTYTKSQGAEFSINTLTSPLYVNTLWSYLYNWYGKNKYGYTPSWTGQDQVGQLGNNLPIKNVSNHYFISEPTYGIPQFYVDISFGEEDAKTTLVEEKNFGDIKVQKRVFRK